MEELKKKNDTQIDTRLLSEAIIELNISRHNVSVYPEDHPILEKSLIKVHEIFQELFQLRDNISLAIAKETIIVDECTLDRKHPVFKDFALYLSNMSIASITFSKGMKKEELYSFHHFLLGDYSASSVENLAKEFNSCNMKNIDIEFIDYAAFDFVDQDLSARSEDVSVWEKYVLYLLKGHLKTHVMPDDIQDVSPSRLAEVINSVALKDIKQESYDRVISAYLRESTKDAISHDDLKKLFECIYRLKPEIKRQFLKSAISNVAQDVASLHQALQEMPLDTIQKFLTLVNDEMVVIPDTLKNVLDKFGKYEHNYKEAALFGGSLLEDDILLSPEVTGLLSESNFKSFVSETYEMEIEKVLRHKSENVDTEWINSVESEWNDEHIDRMFHEMILEFLSSDNPDMILQDENTFMEDIIKEHISKFIETSQYEEVLTTLNIIAANKHREQFQGLLTKIIEYSYSPELLSLLVNSLRMGGRHRRDAATQLCTHYGSRIVPFLIEALINEDSPSVRRFFIALLTGLGDEAMPEVSERLKDSRWFVKRNMLFILLECGSEEDLKKARPLCKHENPKVCFEALKCLLKAEDHYGIKCLREYLQSDIKDIVRRSVNLAGAYRVNEVIPELAHLMRKKAVRSSDFEDKIPIAKALGQIGGAIARAELKKILDSRSFFFKGPLAKLKEEICIVLDKRRDDSPEVSGNSAEGEIVQNDDHGQREHALIS